MTDEQIESRLESVATEVMSLGREWRHRRSGRLYFVTDVVLDPDDALRPKVVFQASTSKLMRLCRSWEKFRALFEPV